MFEIEKYKASFDDIHAPESARSEVLDMTINRENKGWAHRYSRRFTVLALAAAMILALGAAAYADRIYYGWSGNQAFEIHRTDEGIVVKGKPIPAGQLEQVEIQDGRLYFVVNGEHIDITDEVSQTQCFQYELEDETGAIHHWAIGLDGPGLEDYGYIETVFSEGLAVSAGAYEPGDGPDGLPLWYCDADGLPIWVRDAKARGLYDYTVTIKAFADHYSN